jgi:hypothetical protein
MRRRPLVNLFAKGLALSKGPIKAPERVCLWEPGLVRGDFGENVWDAVAAEEVMQNFFARGNPLPIDVEHGTNPKANPKLDLNNPPKGGGYALLEVDARGALWAVDIAWSDYARAEIESGSRRAISPDWQYDPTSKRPVRLNKISLVQNPGTHGIGLMASASGARENNMDTKMLRAALMAALATKDEASMRAALEAVVGELGDGAATELTDPALEMAGADTDPMADMKKVIASALARLDADGSRAATAAAPPRVLQTKPALSENAIRVLVRSETAAAHRDALAIEGLIASAKTSPGYTEGLAGQLRTLPAGTVKVIVANLAPAAGAGVGTSATAAAAAPAGAVKTGALPGAAPEKPAVNAVEQRSIEIINGASPALDDAIASAEKAAKDGLAEGVGRFSAMPQIRGRKSSATKA